MKPTAISEIKQQLFVDPYGQFNLFTCKTYMDYTVKKGSNAYRTSYVPSIIQIFLRLRPIAIQFKIILQVYRIHFVTNAASSSHISTLLLHQGYTLAD
jgi:hypothetical protein